MNKYSKCIKLANESLKKNMESILAEKYPLEACYKLPLALSCCGKKELSDFVITSIENRFSEELHFFDDFENGRLCDYYYDYWILLNYIFSKNEKSKLAYKNILSSFNSKHKGFSSDVNKKGEMCEVRASAFSGICAFLMEDFQTSLDSAEFLINMFNLNKSQDEFYFRIDSNGEVITDYVEKYERLYKYNENQAKPLYYSFFLAVTNLCLNYIHKKDVKYVDYAEKYFNYLNIYTYEDKFYSYSGKLGIASALLYLITNKKCYFNIANETLENFYETQSKDGNWNVGTYLTNEYSYQRILDIDRTSEFIVSVHAINHLLCQKAMNYVAYSKVDTL